MSTPAHSLNGATPAGATATGQQPPVPRTPIADSAAAPPPSIPLPEVSRHAWREQVRTSAAELRTVADWLANGQHGSAARQAAYAQLDEAIRNHLDDAVRATDGEKWPDMSSGARIVRATSNLDAAEAHLLRRAPLDYLRGQLPSLHAHVRRYLAVDDPRRMRVDRLALEGKRRPLTEYDRESLIGAVRGASSAAQREQQRVRSFRNILIVATAVLGAVAFVVAVLGWTMPQRTALCFLPQGAGKIVCPTGESLLSTGQGTSTGATGLAGVDVDPIVGRTVSHWDVALVEVIGTVAAAVTGAVALRRLRGTSTPYGVPLALIVLKLPTGALTAFLGLLLMRGGFVPGLTALDSTPQILAWAVVFGASQQLVTGLVDRQAQTVLDSVGNKAYVPAGPS